MEIKDKYRRFGEWKQQPHQVAPLSEDEHECATCSTHYEGNYCPRCGQSARIGRYSFKKALLLFLDVWGVGNRGMFRSIRDLLLRPGYMIRDYLRGMQMAYFPPFKMLFLLCTLSFLIDSGLNIQGINRYKLYMQEQKEYAEQKKAEAQNNKTLTEASRATKMAVQDMMYLAEEKIKEYYQFVMLGSLLVFSLPLWLLIRRCPAIPDLRLSECFVSMVYIANIILIYSLIPSLLCFSFKAESRFNLVAVLLAVIPIKQLSGYSYWGTIWRLLLALIPFIFILLLLYWATALYIVFTEHPEFLQEANIVATFVDGEEVFKA